MATKVMTRAIFVLWAGVLVSPPVWTAEKAVPPAPVHERSADMDTIHQLFGESSKIQRSVKKLVNGVDATTESGDPKVQALLREHVHAMHGRLRKKQPIRAWDPLFSDLFKHASKIKVEVFPTSRGIRTRLTSGDPSTVRLIHAHADAVTTFIREGSDGMARRHESPLVQPTRKAPSETFLGKGDGVKTCPVTGEPAVSGVSANIKGRAVIFCCKSCVDVVRKSPERYLRNR